MGMFAKLLAKMSADLAAVTAEELAAAGAAIEQGGRTLSLC